MFKNVFAYAGAYKSRTYEAMGVMLVALIAYVAQYAFLFQIIRPLLEHEALGVAAVLPGCSPSSPAASSMLSSTCGG